MNSILVPLDGSAIAREALPYVQILARTLSAKIILLRVLSNVDKDHMMSSPSTVLYDMGQALETGHTREQAIWSMLLEQAQNYLDVQAKTLRTAGFDVEVDIRIGSPADMIVRLAERGHVTLIVMATHGYSGLRRWALGSVTDKVVQAAHTPVFIVRGQAPLPPEEVKLKRILVPLDGSGLARSALPCALELATCSHAELLLLRVIRPFQLDQYAPMPIGSLPLEFHAEEIMASLHQEAVDDLASVAGELRPYDLSVTTHVATGHPAEMIVDEAVHHNIDLIVMATHGYGSMQRWALGSIADKVLHATTRPLILVRANAAN